MRRSFAIARTTAFLRSFHRTRPIFPWSIGGSFSTSDIKFDTGREITLTRISIDLGYSVSPRADFVVTLGNDDNDLGPVPTAADSDGFFWLAGLSGSLDDATDYEVRVGEQFFGDSYLLQFNRTRGRLALNVSYNEQATTFGSSQLGGLGGLGALVARPGALRRATTRCCDSLQTSAVSICRTCPRMCSCRSASTSAPRTRWPRVRGS